MSNELNPQEVRPSNIWNYKQNHTKLIIRDLEYYGVPPEITANILMARGVYKWFACRKDIIQLKNDIKKRIREIHQQRETIAGTVEWHTKKGELKALESVRKSIREICHSQRWRFQDDHETNYLVTLKGE